MLSAGNDIVALSGIDVARTNTKKFYSKILSQPEIALYEQLSGKILFERYVWLLWSIKESAYKFLKRFDTDLLFTPVKFKVKQLVVPAKYELISFDGGEDASSITGYMQFGGHQLYSKSMIYDGLISSVVDSDKDFNGVYSNIKHISSTGIAIQSAEVRAFLIGELLNSTGRSTLDIKKNQYGIPLLVDGLDELPIPISLSHHGNYIAYSFKLNNLSPGSGNIGYK